METDQRMGDEQQPPDDAPPPVLYVVDDDASTVELVRDVAQAAGWVAYGFQCIGEVRATLNERRPTLLVLDDDLPDGRGGDLARELQQDPHTEDMPLLVCTAAPSSRRAEIRSWAPVLPKPFDLFEFEHHLERHVRNRSAAAG